MAQQWPWTPLVLRCPVLPGRIWLRWQPSRHIPWQCVKSFLQAPRLGWQSVLAEVSLTLQIFSVHWQYSNIIHFFPLPFHMGGKNTRLRDPWSVYYSNRDSVSKEIKRLSSGGPGWREAAVSQKGPPGLVTSHVALGLLFLNPFLFFNCIKKDFKGLPWRCSG